jgi:hypothetical protein
VQSVPAKCALKLRTPPSLTLTCCLTLPYSFRVIITHSLNDTTKSINLKTLIELKIKVTLVILINLIAIKTLKIITEKSNNPSKYKPQKQLKTKRSHDQTRTKSAKRSNGNTRDSQTIEFNTSDNNTTNLKCPTKIITTKNPIQKPPNEIKPQA